MKKYIVFFLSLLMLGVAPVAAQEDDSEELAAPRKEKVVKPRKQYPTRVVKGRVLNAASKAPVSGAMVRAAEVEGKLAILLAAEPNLVAEGRKGTVSATRPRRGV